MIRVINEDQKKDFGKEIPMDNGASSYRRFLYGDNNALEELVSEYRTGLCAYIFSIVKNLSVAEDLTEDVFVKLIVKKPKNKELASFKTWLYTIGRNLALDWLRKNSDGKHIPLEEAENLKNEEKSFEDMYYVKERDAILHKTLERLNGDYRQILHLYYFEEFSLEEISKIIKKSRRNTSAILYRAKQTLKKELEKETFNYEI